MRAKRITTERIAAFVRFLQQEERSSGTIENYLRDVRQFVRSTGESILHGPHQSA